MNNITHASYDPLCDRTATPSLPLPTADDPPPVLCQQTATSFSIMQATPQRLVYWLIDQHGYQMMAARSPCEVARLRTRRGQIIVIYRSGSILVQGQYVSITIALLGQLVAEEQPEAVQEVLL